ncbi:MAG: sigma-54-dependent Fis family transcriptional regulator [Myxococcales bacterium]|nr:sigma-54-dependent Fis family transcriptional regulator [Myxococcales bacterium]
MIDDGDRHIELAHRFLRDYDYATRCDLPGPCWTCERRPGCTLTHAHDVQEADDALARHADVDVVLLDVAFDLPVERLAPSREPDLAKRRRLQGIDILAHLRRARGDLPVVLMTAVEELGYEDAATALAVDEFVTLAGAEAFDARALGLLVERVLARRREAPEAGGYRFGRTPAMARLRRDALTLARTSLPMLLLGETGTGKSALAERVVHPATGRPGQFVSVDLAAIPPTLVAAELFGTARGAFSGAVERPGRLERAHRGTLLLDEIGNLPPEVQRMLLVALEEGRVTRLGESAPRPVDVKLVAATNSDLAASVHAGGFRADLHARLNPSARLTLPPLRERAGDLEELMRAFLRRTFAAGADRALLAAYTDAAGIGGPLQVDLAIGRAPQGGHGVVFVVAAGTMTALRDHSWPGNVRELGLLTATAAVFALADAVRAAEEGRATAASARTIPIPAKLVRDLLAGAAEPRVAVERRMAVSLSPAPTLRQVAQEMERQVYRRLFEETDGDFTAMARRLLGGDGASGARRVQLRFNQLGLSARRLGRRRDPK